MEFLDSLDFQTSEKTNRVRSWYLYEQFKSLENNQLEAARKLKNRYYQDKILRRELSERKARRALYDKCERNRTESRIECNVKNVDTKTSLIASNDDFFEGCYQLEDEQSDHDNSVHDDNCIQDEQSEVEIEHDEISQDGSYMEPPSSGFKSIAGLDDSIASVVENLKDSENITDEIKEELEFVKHGIAENITLQLEAAKENVHCLEELSDFCMDDKLSIQESVHSFLEAEETRTISVSKDNQRASNNLVALWMKLVSFAYQVIQLNNGGNCYCDYSSQFLTAVLACDVIRRGFSRMCDILQPYVCPIEFFSDEPQSTSCYKNVKRKTDIMKNSYNTLDFEPCSIRSIDRQRKNHICKCNTRYNTENFSNCKCKNKYKRYNVENIKNPKCKSQCGTKRNVEKILEHSEKCFKKRIASEPLPNVSRKVVSQEHSHKTHSTLWPSELMSKSEKTRHCNCVCHARARNPMLKIARYIDDILEHMDHL